MTTPDPLDLRALAEKATPTPWFWDSEHDARYIVALVNAAPAVLDTLDAQAAELERLRRVEAAARALSDAERGLGPAAHRTCVNALRQALEDDHAG
jgi:hypothetical protein